MSKWKDRELARTRLMNDYPKIEFEAHKLSRNENPTTSKEAAASCKGIRIKHHDTILEVMRGSDRDWIADEVAAQCDLNRHQVGRRMGELYREGYLVKSGAKRPTPTGRMAEAYILALDKD